MTDKQTPERIWVALADYDPDYDSKFTIAEYDDGGAEYIRADLVCPCNDKDCYFTAAYLAERGWQPIETAPKDGTGFFYFQRIDNTHQLIGSGYFKNGHVWAVNFFSEFDEQINPSHWMPLPPAPDNGG